MCDATRREFVSSRKRPRLNPHSNSNDVREFVCVSAVVPASLVSFVRIAVRSTLCSRVASRRSSKRRDAQQLSLSITPHPLGQFARKLVAPRAPTFYSYKRRPVCHRARSRRSCHDTAAYRLVSTGAALSMVTVAVAAAATATTIVTAAVAAAAKPATRLFPQHSSDSRTMYSNRHAMRIFDRLRLLSNDRT